MGASSPHVGPWARWLGQAVLFLLLLAPVVATLPDYGLSWDEPFYLWSQERQREWFAELIERPRQALRADEIEKFWNAASYQNPHPPLYKVLSNLTWAVAGRSPTDWRAFRLAPAILFAASGLLLFRLVSRTRGTVEGLAAALLWSSVPPVFAHAHFAATDTPMTFFAIASALAFLRAVESPRMAVVLGVVFGAAFATKFSALLLPIPPLLWTLLHREPRGLRVLVVAGLVAGPVAIALTPYWWHEPARGIAEFVVTSTSRQAHTVIPSLHWGRVYEFHAPWTHAWTLLAIATPLTFWVPALVGGAWTVKGKLAERDESLFLLAAVVPVTMTMLPSAPSHDGLRLFLPALPFVGALAARGIERLAALVEMAVGRHARSPSRAGIVALLATVGLACQSRSIAEYHPYEMSYYNALVGGLPGAAKRGMEITCWMEVFTNRNLQALEAALPEGAQVNLTVGEPTYFMYLQARGLFRRDIRFLRRQPAPYTLVLSRVASVTPELMKSLEGLPTRFSVVFEGVPIVRLFAAEDMR